MVDKHDAAFVFDNILSSAQVVVDSEHLRYYHYPTGRQAERFRSVRRERETRCKTNTKQQSGEKVARHFGDLKLQIISDQNYKIRFKITKIWVKKLRSFA